MKVVQVPLPKDVLCWITQKVGVPCQPVSVQIHGITYKLRARHDAQVTS